MSRLSIIDSDHLETLTPQELVAHISHAFCNLDMKMIRTLVTKFGADVNLPKNEQDTFPFWCEAIRYENATMCDLFLALGANPNSKTHRNGYTPLHLAYEYYNEDVIEVLLKYGANPLIESMEGLRPIDMPKYRF